MQQDGNVFVRLMGMDEQAWRRHANPLSVWSRAITGLPVILLSVWSIKWLLWWSLPVLAVAFLWLWLNPRLFSIPNNTDNWASRATFGERVWLNRAVIAIPGHHHRWALFLSVIAGVGFLLAVVAAYFNLLLATISAGMVCWLGKLWFCDRMVWLYQDMSATSEEYASWLLSE